MRLDSRLRSVNGSSPIFVIAASGIDQSSKASTTRIDSVKRGAKEHCNMKTCYKT